MGRKKYYKRKVLYKRKPIKKYRKKRSSKWNNKENRYYKALTSNYR